MQPDIISHPAPVRWGVLSVANIGVKRVIPALIASSNGAFMYRFHPQIIWALEQVRTGRIGTVKLVRASFAFNVMLPPRPHNIRLQAALVGGSLMDVGSYPVNFCRAVFGHPPVAVAARVY